MTDLTLDAYNDLPLREIEEKLREERVKILGLEKGYTVRETATGSSHFKDTLRVSITAGDKGFLFTKLMRPMTVNDADNLEGS